MRRAKPPRPSATGQSGRREGDGTHDRISAGRSSIWIERGGAAGLLPHEAGPVGDLLLGQAGDDGDPAWLGSGSEELRQEFRRARHRLRPFRLRRRPRHTRHIVLHAARRPRGGGRIRRGRAHEQGRRLPARRNSPLVEQLPEARGRLSPQGHAAVPVHGTQDRHARVFPRAPPRARSHTSHRTATASSFADRSARPTAPTTSAPRCCSSCRTGRRRTSSGTRSRLPRTADIRAMRASPAGCSATDWCWIDGSKAG